MHATFLGVRGSLPAPGPAFTRYGGNSPCVALGHDGEPATLVLDAGSGLRNLGSLLDGRPFRGTILLGHLHWDHVCGLPFSGAIDHPDAVVRLLVPRQDSGSAVDFLRRMMSPPFFPIEPEQLRGAWSIEWHDAGACELEGFDVLSLDLPHPGGRCLGHRVADRTAAIAYVTDHGPQALGPGPNGFGPLHDDAMALADGVDLLIHDAPYTAEEFPSRAAFGHAAMPYAVALAAQSGARELTLFGHDPGRTDDELDVLVAALRRTSTVPLSAAVEGSCHRLPDGAGRGFVSPA